MTDLIVSDIGAATGAGTYLAVADLRSGTALFADLVLSVTQASDATLGAAIAGAERIIESYTGDDFLGDIASTSSIIIDGPDADPTGRGHTLLMLPRRVQSGSVTTVETRDTAGAYTTVPAADYRVYASLDAAGTDRTTDAFDAVEKIAGAVWPAGVLNIRVTAKFGWQAVPFPIKRACALIVWDWLSGKNASLHRATIWTQGPDTYQRAEDALLGLPEVKELLDGYRATGPVAIAAV